MWELQWAIASRLGRLTMPRQTWSMPPEGKSLYLTFDDGPLPKLTPWVVEQLGQRGQKASFFWLGQNLNPLPQMVALLLQHGHTLGNHTWQHTDGWQVPTAVYLDEVQRTNELMQGLAQRSIRYFRPPYGRLPRGWYRSLPTGQQTVLGDFLVGDWLPNRSETAILRQLASPAPGSIVILHEKPQCEDRIRRILPAMLDNWANQGYDLRPLPWD